MEYKYKKKRTGGIKVGDKLLRNLAEECSSPKELIKAVLSLKNMTCANLGEAIGKTEKHIIVTLHKSGNLGPTMLYEISVGLNINPTIVFRCWADWKLKQEQEAHT
jgi:hypothetical protein